MSEENASDVAQEGAGETGATTPKRAKGRKITIGGVVVAAVILTISLLQFTTLGADDTPSAVDRFNSTRSEDSSLSESDEPTDKVTPQYTDTEPEWSRLKTKKPTPVKSYKFEANYIRVKYKDGTVLLFTDDSCGEERVDEMQQIAEKGGDLDEYIKDNVEDMYAEKKTCD